MFDATLQLVETVITFGVMIGLYTAIIWRQALRHYHARDCSECDRQRRHEVYQGRVRLYFNPEQRH